MSYQNARTTDKYVKVRKQAEKAPENEVRIKAVPRIGRYISYAATLLLEKKLDIIILKASGNAAKSACQIAEILRHRILGLYQLNLLKTVSVTDEYEPKEEGLDRVVVERQLAVLEIHLSLKDGAFDSKNVGYQAPLPKDQVQEEDLKNLLEGRKRGGEEDDGRPRRRGGRGGYRGRGGYAGNRGGRRGGDRRDDNRGGDRGYDNRRDDNRGERRDDNRGGDRGYDNRRDDNRGGERRDNNRGGDRGYDNRRDDNRGERRDNNRGGDRGYDNRRDDNRGGERRDNTRRDDNRGGERRDDNRGGERRPDSRQQGGNNRRN